MRLYLILFAVLLFFVDIQAQDIAIPYRQGAKWGICNPNGELLIQPQFDSLQFREHVDHNYETMFSFKGSKMGFINKGKEILPAIYYDIIFVHDIIKAVKRDGKQQETYLFTSEGIPLLQSPLLAINSINTDRVHEKGNESYKVYALHVTNPDLTQSFFVWNDEAKAISQWLFKDVYSVSLKRVREKGYVNFLVKQKKDSSIEIKRFIYEAGVFKEYSLAPGKEQLTIEEQLAMKADYYGREAAPSIEMDMGEVGTYHGNITIEGEAGRTAEPHDAPRVNYQHVTFLKDGGKLKLQRTINYTDKKTITFKFQPQEFTIKTFSGKRKQADTLYSYNNYVVYKNKSKWGAITNHNITAKQEFDTLNDVYYTSHKNWEQRLSFIVGVRDKKTKAFKYGIMDYDGQLTIPVIYDHITVNRPGGGKDYNDWTVMLNGKYGIVNPDGTTVFSAEYDSITYMKAEYSNILLQLKKGDRYGFFTRTNNAEIISSGPVYSYPVNKVYINYPSRNSSYSSPVAKEQMILVSLTDEAGKIVGFANKDGKLYFED